MRVAIAVHNHDLGEGTGGYVVRLLPFLARQHDVTLYAARVRSPVPDGVHVVRVPAVMTTAYTAILSFPVALRTVLRKHDLLHAQGWVATKADIVTAHIVLAAWREAARDAGIRAPLGERYLGAFVQRREASLFRRARHVITPSARARQDIAQHYGRTHDVTVIHHAFPAVPPSRDRAAARRSLGLPTDPLLALFVGDPRKGLAVAMAAVADTPKAHLAVVSHSAPQAWLGYARALAVESRVHWLGSLDDASLAYAASDVLLHPTICDSFGLVVAEAMAHGVPPVTTAAAGIAELITDRESGWIVEGDTAAGIRAALRALAADGQLRRGLAAGAAAAARRRTWDDVARETLALYERVGTR